MTDKNFCMSSYLMYRYLYDESKDFGLPHKNIDINFERTPIADGEELINFLKKKIESVTADGKAALALSGGIDSAILAKFMPEGSTAYTFRCLVPGKKVEDESERAAHYAEICKLNHKIIDIYWEDVESVVDKLMQRKGAPIHSIETQIYIAAKKVLADGFTKFIFGENADIIYGGMDGLLAKNWTFGEFVERYSYVMPYKVLKNPELPLSPFNEFETNGYIDGHDFVNKYFRQEALSTYSNACGMEGIEFIAPYALTKMKNPIDYKKIRSGESKYIVRDAFRKLYPGEDIPKKTPMPRPVNEWFENWEGPTREEFLPHCQESLNGNQRWMVWCLERFLNLIEK
ncbi:MAG: asparagine synthase [Selenomonadaceae bacterium]|nr:asparagine synthase [Selenomonadaceae bacterium]